MSDTNFLEMTEREYLASGNPCRAPRGSKPGTVSITCRGCGHEWEGRVGWSLKCPECGVWNPPKYPLEFLQVLQRAFTHEREPNED